MTIKLASDFSPVQDRVHTHRDQLSQPPKPATALEFSTSHDSCVQTPRCSVLVAVWNGPKTSPGIIPAMSRAILPQGSAWPWGWLCLRSTAAAWKLSSWNFFEIHDSSCPSCCTVFKVLQQNCSFIFLLHHKIHKKTEKTWATEWKSKI